MTPERSAQAPVERALRVLAISTLATPSDLERGGVSRTQAGRLVASGVLERVGRGLYRRSGMALSEQEDLAAAARLVPGGTVCLLSALRFHGLTTQNPGEVWLAIARKAWRPRPGHPPLRVVYLSGAPLTEGVEVHDVGGVRLRVFGVAKTVADCFKFRNKTGTDVAVEALRAFRRSHPKQLESLWRYAEADRVARVMGPYLEAIW